jgi:hypothetical protein
MPKPLTQVQQEQTRLLAREVVGDTLQQIKQELLPLKVELKALKDSGAVTSESVNKLTITVDRLLMILSGDDQITHEPGLIARVRTLEGSSTKAGLERAKMIGIGIGVVVILKMLWGGISAFWGK